jgi:RimJ/RimL family protein N-acetyltransferase
MHHELVLQGPVVTLRPLVVSDAADLAVLTSSSPTAAEDLRWHTSPPPVDEPTARAEVERLHADPTTMAFAVVGTVHGELRGITAFYEHAPAVPRVEVGHTQYGRQYWGSATNPATKLLMLTHAFEEWRCVRVALRCDARNERSAGAIRRLGARPEGVLRNHRRSHDGTVADTAYFSITDQEWPSVREDLRARVAP